MSITLDVNNFLKNASASSTKASNGGKGKMEAMLHHELGIAELPKESTSIFDEIEQLLRSNKFNDNNDSANSHVPMCPLSDVIDVEPLQSLPLPQAASTIPPPPPAILVSSPNLEFAEFALPNPTDLTDLSDFLLTDDTVSDTQLYSVEEGELQPITSPFMVPGIYKKLSNALVSKHAAATHATEQSPKNVFISASEQHGRIVHAEQFQDLYICAKENGELPEEFLKASHYPSLLLEELEQSENQFTAHLKPCSNREPKQWDALSKLAYDILKLSNRDQIVIDRKRNEIVRTDKGSSQKTIYRFLSPEDFNLTPHRKHEVSLPPFIKDSPSPSISSTNPKRQYAKLGRPRKQRIENDIESDIINKNTPKAKKLKQKQENTTITTAATSIEPTIRTRSGRAVRQRLPIKHTTELNTQKNSFPNANDDSVDFINSFLADLKDSDYRCSKPISPIATTSSKQKPTKTNTVPSNEANNSSSPIKRNIPPEAICPTCGKKFLGRRMQRHYIQYPDHMHAPIKHVDAASSPAPPPPSPQQQHYFHDNGEQSLFRFLVSKLQKSHLSEDQRADLFLHEINDLVAQLQLRSSRLIRNTSGLHFVSARCSRVLGIPEGQYALDMTAIENEAPPPPPIEPPEPPVPCILNFENLSSSALPVPSTTNPRNLDYTALSMSLDDTLTDEAAQKLNLSAGGKLLPPSEESLLRTVDDLVHDGMQKLTHTAPILLHPPVNMVSSVSHASVPPNIHYDHASDNAVEAVTMKETTAVQQTPPILGLPVDFFQFNNNND